MTSLLDLFSPAHTAPLAQSEVLAHGESAAAYAAFRDPERVFMLQESADGADRELTLVRAAGALVGITTADGTLTLSRVVEIAQVLDVAPAAGAASTPVRVDLVGEALLTALADAEPETLPALVSTVADALGVPTDQSQALIDAALVEGLLVDIAGQVSVAEQVRPLARALATGTHTSFTAFGPFPDPRRPADLSLLDAATGAFLLISDPQEPTTVVVHAAEPALTSALLEALLTDQAGLFPMPASDPDEVRARWLFEAMLAGHPDMGPAPLVVSCSAEDLSQAAAALDAAGPPEQPTLLEACVAAVFLSPVRVVVSGPGCGTWTLSVLGELAVLPVSEDASGFLAFRVDDLLRLALTLTDLTVLAPAGLPLTVPADLEVEALVGHPDAVGPDSRAYVVQLRSDTDRVIERSTVAWVATPTGLLLLDPDGPSVTASPATGAEVALATVDVLGGVLRR